MKEKPEHPILGKMITIEISEATAGYLLLVEDQMINDVLKSTLKLSMEKDLNKEVTITIGQLLRFTTATSTVMAGITGHKDADEIYKKYADKETREKHTKDLKEKLGDISMPQKPLNTDNLN